MDTDNIRSESRRPEDRCIVRKPGQDFSSRSRIALINTFIIAKGQPDPLLDNLTGVQIRVPGQSPETIEIGQRQIMPEPVGVMSDIRDRDKPAG
jgi:hypothetical protein